MNLVTAFGNESETYPTPASQIAVGPGLPGSDCRLRGGAALVAGARLLVATLLATLAAFVMMTVGGPIAWPLHLLAHGAMRTFSRARFLWPTR